MGVFGYSVVALSVEELWVGLEKFGCSTVTMCYVWKLGVVGGLAGCGVWSLLGNCVFVFPILFG